MARSVWRRMPASAGLAVASLVLTMAPLSAPAQAASRPSIDSITALAWTDPGATLPATVKVTNRSSATTPRETLRLYLSKDKRYSASDDDVPGTVTVRKLRPGRHVTEHLQLDVPRHAHLGRRWLLGCIDGHCTPSTHRVHVTATPKTSAALIDAARAAHDISAGTAVVYKVFSAFGDSRLPTRYRGDDHPLVGDLATRDAVAAWPTLSAKQRKLLAPFLQGPAGPRGWGHPAVATTQPGEAVTGCQHLGPEGDGFAHLNAPGGHVRIWWPRSGLPLVAKAATRVARQAAHIWDRLSALMGRVPVSDGSFCGRNGGDGRYDIYLLANDNGGEVTGRAITGPYRGYSLTKAAPAVTYFNCWADDAPSGWELAHEMFHAFQFSYRHAVSIKKYDGFDEGSADWAANYVYPTADVEHTDDTLLRYPEYRTLPDNDYGYELWAFDLYLTEKFGNDLIPQIYTAFQHEDELTALNSMIPGGFEKRIPDFARYGWNQTPVKGGFRSWDRFAAIPWKEYLQPVKPLDLRIGQLERRTLNLRDSLRPLARTYYPLHVADSHIRSLRFDNTVKSIRGASVEAFVKLADGSWHTQNWTNRRTVEFCRDAGPDQNVTDLVIMYGNARYQDSKPLAPAKQPTLEIRNNCNHYYVVTKVSGSYTEKFSYTDTNHAYPCTDSGTQHYAVTRDPARTDAVDPTDGFWAPGKFGGLFVPLTFTGSESYQQDSCHGGDIWRKQCTAKLSDTGSPLAVLGDLSDGPDRVTVQLPTLGHLGDFYSDTPCDSDFNYTPGSDPVNYLDAGKVSVATLEGSAPFTLTGTNTYTDPTGHKYSRGLSVTLKPTDEDGQPLQ